MTVWHGNLISTVEWMEWIQRMLNGNAPFQHLSYELGSLLPSCSTRGMAASLSFTQSEWRG